MDFLRLATVDGEDKSGEITTTWDGAKNLVNNGMQTNESTNQPRLAQTFPASLKSSTAMCQKTHLPPYQPPTDPEAPVVLSATQ